MFPPHGGSQDRRQGTNNLVLIWGIIFGLGTVVFLVSSVFIWWGGIQTCVAWWRDRGSAEGIPLTCAVQSSGTETYCSDSYPSAPGQGARAYSRDSCPGPWPGPSLGVPGAPLGAGPAIQGRRLSGVHTTPCWEIPWALVTVNAYAGGEVPRCAYLDGRGGFYNQNEPMPQAQPGATIPCFLWKDAISLRADAAPKAPVSTMVGFLLPLCFLEVLLAVAACGFSRRFAELHDPSSMATQGDFVQPGFYPGMATQGGFAQPGFYPGMSTQGGFAQPGFY